MAGIIRSSWVKRVVERRERNGELEYKVFWVDFRRFPSWIARGRFENLRLVEALDERILRAQQVREHQEQRTRNMRIVAERTVGNSVQYLVAWSGQTWEPSSEIPDEVMNWTEEKLLRSPSSDN